jgi:hypothetical protein
MANSGLVRREAPPLPEKIQDWQRFLKQERTLNDMLEDVHRALVDENDQYRSYLRAVWDSHAVEGSLAADNLMAASLLREKAKDMGNELQNEKLAIIVKVLGIVLRRYHASRKERRNMIGGEMVPSEHAPAQPDNDSE